MRYVVMQNDYPVCILECKSKKKAEEWRQKKQDERDKGRGALQQRIFIRLDQVPTVRL